MVFVISFFIFLLFVTALAIGMIFKRGGLKSESEAHELLEGMTCAACANTSCGFQGQKQHQPETSCGCTGLKLKDIEYKEV